MSSLAEAVIHYRQWFCYVQLVLVVVCVVYTVRHLQFSTDTSDLISVRESYRHQFLRFKSEFNVQENLFVLVESESREKNREFVERLAARLRSDREFGGVYFKASLALMGPKALLFLQEETLAELRQNLRTNELLFQNYSRATNLDSVFGLVNRQLRAVDFNGGAVPAEGTLPRSLRTLKRVVDEASEAIESRQTPIAPDLRPVLGGSPYEQELYLTFDGGGIYVLVAQAKNESGERAAIDQLAKRISQTRPEVPGVNVEMTGEPVLKYGEMEQARHDTEKAALIALALTALIIIGSCREVLRPLMATVCLLTGICYSLGLATLTVGRLNILSITLVPILIGLAIDYGVHLIFRYEEEVRQGQRRRVAISKALGFTGIGVITNALTIAGAFYCMLLTGFKGMQEMGFIAGSGVLVCLIPMLTLLPLLLVRGKPDESDQRGRRRRKSGHDSLMISLPFARRIPEPIPMIQTWRARVGQLYLKRPWAVLVCGSVFTVFAVVQCFNLQFNYNLLDLQSRGLPAARMLKQMAGKGSLLYCAVIADSLPQAAEWERRIEQLPSVGRVISLVKYLTEDQERKLRLIHEIKEELGAIPLPAPDTGPVDLGSLNQALFSLSGHLGLGIDNLHSPGGNGEAEELLRSVRRSVSRLRQLTVSDNLSVTKKLTEFQRALFGSVHETIRQVEEQEDRQPLQAEDVPAVLRKFLISSSGKFLLQVYPKEDIWERDKQETFINELRTVDPNVTGSPVQFYEYTSRLRENVEKAATYAAGIIALLVFLHFRRLSSVVLGLLPVALGFCWMLGLMGWLKIPFNPVNIISLILVIGIGVTNGVHILNRFAEEQHPNVLARSTGKAVLVSALNTMAGFGSLMVAKHQGIASLGMAMVIGTGTCLVASLAFLPAVLTLLCRIGWCPTDPERSPA